MKKIFLLMPQFKSHSNQWWERR